MGRHHREKHGFVPTPPIGYARYNAVLSPMAPNAVPLVATPATQQSHLVMSSNHERIIQKFHLDGRSSVRWLQRYFAKAWRSDQSWEQTWEQMRSGAQRWAKAVDEHVLSLAKSQSVPPLQMLRNLLINEFEDSLPLWNCAVRLGEFQGFGTNDEAAKLIESACTREKEHSEYFRSLQTAIDALCNDKSLPELSAVSALADYSAIGQFAMEVSLRRNLDSKALVVLLNSLEYGDPCEHVLVPIAVVRRLVDHLAYNSSARLSFAQYESLPEFLTKTIAATGNTKHILIEGVLEARAARQAHRDAESAQRSARIREAHECIQSAFDLLKSAALRGDRCAREWSSLSKLLTEGVSQNDRAEVFSTFPNLMDQFPACLAILPAATSGVRKALDEIRGFAGIGALRIWAAPSKSRALVYDSVDKSWQLPATWVEHIFQCAMDEFIRTTSAKRRLAIWREWSAHHALLGPCLATCKHLAKADIEVIFEWFLLGTDSDRAAFQSTHRELADFVTKSPRVAGLLLTIFDSKNRSDATACEWVDRVTLSQWRILATRTSVSKLRNFCTRLCTSSALHASRAGTRGRRRFIVAAAKSLTMKELVSVLGRGIDDTDAVDLFRLWHYYGSDLLGGRVLASLKIDNSPAWSRIISKRKFMTPGTRVAVWEALRLADSTAALDAAFRAPNYFARLAVAHLSSDLLLPAALKSQKLAYAIDRSISRESMLEALPIVRAKMGMTPLRFAVLEVAVLSSLQDIKYIWHLARLSHERSESNQRGFRFDDAYKTYEIPKRSGGTRTITAPNPSLKRLQRRLLANGLNAIALHPSAHGFRREHSIATNAAAHVGRRLVVNVDITGFFPNTKYERILRAVRHIGGGKISPMAVLLLADICSYNGALPTGAPTSPAIGNIVLRSADASIGTVAIRHGIAYTRYADDLTFSGEDDVKRILPFVQKVLEDHGYALDAKKTQLYRRGRQQLVTNLIVNDKVNLKRIDRRRLRAAVHARCNGRPVRWHDRDMDDAALRGRVALLNIVDKPAAAKLTNTLVAHAPNWRKVRVAKQP